MKPLGDVVGCPVDFNTDKVSFSMTIKVIRPNNHGTIEFRSENRLIIIAGPNGVGKSTLISELGTQYQSMRLGTGLGHQRQPMPGAYSHEVRLAPHTVTHQSLEKYILAVGTQPAVSVSLNLGISYEHFAAAISPQNSNYENDPAVTLLRGIISEADKSAYEAADPNEKMRIYNAYHTRTLRPELGRLSEVFTKYHQEYAALKYAGTSPKDIHAKIGAPKWIDAQYALDALGMDYKIEAPDIDKVLPFTSQFNLLRRSDGGLVPGDRMSTGERAALSLYDIITGSPVANRIFLFDDIDGFLHAPLLKRFLALLEDILETQNSFAIWATHSPVTIQFTGKASLYYIASYGSAPTLTNKASLVQILTGGELVIVDSVLNVLVEGADVTFYNGVYNALVLRRPSTFKRQLRFISPRSNKTGADANCVAVNDFVKILSEQGFDESFRGLIDKDGGAFDPHPSTLKLARYSKENYLFDPINIYCYILDNIIEWSLDIPRFDGFGLGMAREFVDRKNVVALQHVINWLSAKLLSDESYKSKWEFPGEKEISIVINENIELSYPYHLVNARGKDMARIIASINPDLNAGRLEMQFLRGSFFPNDLLDTLKCAALTSAEARAARVAEAAHSVPGPD